MKLSQILDTLESQIETALSQARSTNTEPLKYFNYVQKESDLLKDGSYVLLRITRITAKDVLINSMEYFDIEISFAIKSLNRGQDSIKNLLNAVIEISKIIHKFAIDNQINLSDLSCDWNPELFGFEGKKILKNVYIES
jgi:exosome complex RNA-binding protein Csl4